MRNNSVFPAMVIAVTATVSIGFASVTPRVIYGEDNRKDYYQVQDPAVRELANATVALIPRTNIAKQNNGLYKIVAPTFGKDMNLCKNEPYFEQPVAANCSGALVSEDLIATAGHCVTSSDCSDYVYVFNYRLNAATQLPNFVSEDDVYSCTEVVAHEYTRAQDYALLRLDRPVRGVRPVVVSSQGVNPGESVFVIGHPSGLPTKIADGAQVRSLQTGYFVTDLDTYGGNSGSAVFSSRTNQMVGILVRGAQDFAYDNNNRCTRSNYCTQDGCRGEDVTDASYIYNLLGSVQ
ncbi:MAG: trypsin-like serine peptidase [Bdellovibrionia bacterium]